MILSLLFHNPSPLSQILLSLPLLLSLTLLFPLYIYTGEELSYKMEIYTVCWVITYTIYKNAYKCFIVKQFFTIFDFLFVLF